MMPLPHPPRKLAKKEKKKTNAYTKEEWEYKEEIQYCVLTHKEKQWVKCWAYHWLEWKKITQQIYPFCWCRAFRRLAPEINLDQKNYLYKRSTKKKTSKPLQNGIIALFYTYINTRIKELALYLLLTYVVRSSTFYLSILFRNSDFNDGTGVQKAPQISFFKKF